MSGQEKINDDLQQRAIWGKISSSVESALLGINAQIEKRTNKGIVFKSSNKLFEIKIEEK
jgi:hypothetical protein